MLCLYSLVLVLRCDEGEILNNRQHIPSCIIKMYGKRTSGKINVVSSRIGNTCMEWLSLLACWSRVVATVVSQTIRRILSSSQYTASEWWIQRRSRRRRGRRLHKTESVAIGIFGASVSRCNNSGIPNNRLRLSIPPYRPIKNIRPFYLLLPPNYFF